MSINLPMNFDYNANEPLDVRFLVNILNEANTEIPLDTRYPGMIAYMRDMNGLYWLDGDMYTWHRLEVTSLDYEAINDKLMEILMKHDCCDISELGFYPVTYNVTLVPGVELTVAPKYVKANGKLIVTYSFSTNLSYGISHKGNITINGVVYDRYNFLHNPSYIIENVSGPVIFNLEFYAFSYITYILDEGVVLDDQPKSMYSNQEYVLNVTMPDDKVIDMDNSSVRIIKKYGQPEVTLEGAIDDINNTITIPTNTLGAITIKIALKDVVPITYIINGPFDLANKPAYVDSGSTLETTIAFEQTKYENALMGTVVINGLANNFELYHSYTPGDKIHIIKIPNITSPVTINLSGFIMYPIAFILDDNVSVDHRRDYLDSRYEYSLPMTLVDGYEIDLDNSYVTMEGVTLENVINVNNMTLDIGKATGAVEVKLATKSTYVNATWNIPNNTSMIELSPAVDDSSVLQKNTTYTFKITCDDLSRINYRGYNVEGAASYREVDLDTYEFEFTTGESNVVVNVLGDYLLPVEYNLGDGVTMGTMQYYVKYNEDYNNTYVIDADHQLDEDNTSVTVNGVVVEGAINGGVIQLTNLTEGPIVINIATVGKIPITFEYTNPDGGVTMSNTATEIWAKSEYVNVITLGSDYRFGPKKVTVTVDGVEQAGAWNITTNTVTVTNATTSIHIYIDNKLKTTLVAYQIKNQTTGEYYDEDMLTHSVADVTESPINSEHVDTITPPAWIKIANVTATVDNVSTPVDWDANTNTLKVTVGIDYTEITIEVTELPRVYYNLGDGITLSKQPEALELNSAFATTISPMPEYPHVLINSVKVTYKDNPGSSPSYMYSKNNGTLTIYTDDKTDAILVEVETEIVLYINATLGDGVKLYDRDNNEITTFPVKVHIGDAVSFTYQTDENYEIDCDNAAITATGTDIDQFIGVTQGHVYTQSINNDIDIILPTKKLIPVTITDINGGSGFDIPNITIANNATKTYANEPYTNTITVNSDDTIINNITVKANGVEVADAWDADTGEITVTATMSITITIDYSRRIPIVYNIPEYIRLSSKPQYITTGKTLVLEYRADEPLYTTINEPTFRGFTVSDVDTTTQKMTLRVDYLLASQVVINITANVIYPITYDISGSATLSNTATTVARGGSYQSIITLGSDNIIVRYDNSSVTVGGEVVDSAFDQDNNRITISNITGPVVIKIVAKIKKTPFYIYTSTMPKNVYYDQPRYVESVDGNSMASAGLILDRDIDKNNGNVVYKYSYTHDEDDSRIPIELMRDRIDNDYIIYIEDLSIYDGTTNLDELFDGMRNLRGIKFKDVDTSNVTSMKNTFRDTGLIGIDLTSWDTSSVIDMSGMFSRSIISSPPNVSNWNTGSVTNMSYMFNYCKSLTTPPDVSRWDTSGVTDMSYMFNYCTGLTNTPPNVSNWNTGSVTNMSYMFQNCTSLTNPPNVFKWDTSSVTDMSWMFNSCTSLTTPPDVSNWNVSSVTNMWRMFSYCSVLTTPPDTSRWNTSSVTNMGWMFSYCTSLTTPPDVSKWDTSSVISIWDMFSGCKLLATPPDVSGWDVSSVTDMAGVFSACSSLTTPPNVSNWNTSSVTGMSGVFSGCKSLTTPPDVSGWDTSSVTIMGNMFGGCSSLTTPPDTSGWDTSKVTDMNRMFSDCKSLTTTPNMSGWDTSKVTSMNSMFESCYSLTTIDMSNLDTSSISVVNSMFKNCMTLTTLDLTGWILNRSVITTNMFTGCTSLTKAGVTMNRCDITTKNLINAALDAAGIS